MCPAHKLIVPDSWNLQSKCIRPCLAQKSVVKKCSGTLVKLLEVVGHESIELTDGEVHRHLDNVPR